MGNFLEPFLNTFRLALVGYFHFCLPGLRANGLVSRRNIFWSGQPHLDMGLVPQVPPPLPPPPSCVHHRNSLVLYSISTIIQLFSPLLPLPFLFLPFSSVSLFYFPHYFFYYLYSSFLFSSSIPRLFLFLCTLPFTVFFILSSLIHHSF
jgi:hypothetical protein